MEILTSLVDLIKEIIEENKTIFDIVDIFIVAYLFYLIYTLIEKTHAIQVIKGILVIFVVYLIADFFQLRTLLTIIQELFKVAFIAVIILFQPELRRILIKLGENELLGVFKKIPDRLIDMLTESALFLSHERKGALIVLERHTGLRNYIETGTIINALYSHELIVTIFSQKTPLHDGAVILQGNIIIAAACVLPLSKRTDLLTVFGTRHKAAIGLSEETDALVIIVSEETGAISIACENKIFYDLKLDAFKSLLSKYLILKTSTKRKSFWDNVRRKIDDKRADMAKRYNDRKFLKETVNNMKSNGKKKEVTTTSTSEPANVSKKNE